MKYDKINMIKADLGEDKEIHLTRFPERYFVFCFSGTGIVCQSTHSSYEGAKKKFRELMDWGM